MPEEDVEFAEWFAYQSFDARLAITTRLALRAVILFAWADFPFHNERYHRGEPHKSLQIIWGASVYLWFRSAYPDKSGEIHPDVTSFITYYSNFKGRIRRLYRSHQTSTEYDLMRCLGSCFQVPADLLFHGKEDASVRGLVESLSANIVQNNREFESSASVFSISEALWSEIDRDARCVEEGGSTAELMMRPLWDDQVQFKLRAITARLSDKMNGLAGDWDVWMDWYYQRLAGEQRPIGMDLQIVNLLGESWWHSSNMVNAEIAWAQKDAIDPEDPPLLPSAKTSPTNFTVEYGMLQLIDPSTFSVPNDASGIAWLVLRESLQSLKESSASNALRIAPAIDRTLDSLGNAPGDVEVIRCGMAGLELKAFADVSDRVLLEDASAMLKSVVAQHSMFISQFAEWQNFSEPFKSSMAERETEMDAVKDAASLHRQMSEAELLSGPADGRLFEEEVAALPEPSVTGDVPAAVPESQRGFLRSMRSAIRAFAVDVLRKMRENAVKAAAVAVPAGSAYVFLAFSDTLLALAAKLPAEWGWVAQWIGWLKGVIV